MQKLCRSFCAFPRLGVPSFSLNERGRLLPPSFVFPSYSPQSQPKKRLQKSG